MSNKSSTEKESPSQMTEKKFCRICRCEGTTDHPLFHPCKCRGSIKYIHQDCLQFWLEHSGKDICDICHTKFNFQIIYNKGTPDSIPFKLVLKQLFKDLIRYQYKLVKFLLMFFCGFILVPSTIALIDRIIEFQLGVPLKFEQPYLENIFDDYHPTDSIISTSFSYFNSIILRGVLIALTYSTIIVSMIMIQNSFVGDEGFQKIVNKKIGPQRHKLLDMIQQNRRETILRALREQAIIQRVDLELESIGWIDGHVYTQPEIVIMLNTSIRIINQLSENPTLREKYENDLTFLNDLNPESISNDDLTILTHLYRKLRIEHLNNQNVDNEADLVERFQQLAANADVNENANANRNNNPIQQPQQQRLAAAPPARDNDEIEIDQGLWDGPKNIPFILQVTLLAILISMVVLVCFKLIPSYSGLVFLGIFHSLIISPSYKLSIIAYSHIYPYLNPYLFHILNSKTYNYTYNYIISKYDTLIVPKLMFAFFQRNLYIPFRDAYTNSINWTPTNSMFERIFVVFSGFIESGLIMLIIMKKMERSCTPTNPLTGTYRGVYIIMLQIISVVKVFTLIAIEWALFPLFCGIQIEFALVPILNENIYNYKLDPPLFNTNIFGLIPKWLLGTFFMYFFASFVSMIRAKILRNGVLFFIRPSDDPNIQLVHDALMRPFSLRISRIALSAAVYSLYIHIEFSIVSWGIRLFSPIKILPFYDEMWFHKPLYIGMFILGQKLEKIFCPYWKFIFKFVCSKLRLSSFLLNDDNSNERGKIVYKSFWTRFRNPSPDYSNPILISETKQYFETHPDALCCFVPDGTYIRAPNDDHVSRNFVRTLFVPVTKSDQLLAPIPEYPDDDDKYNPYGDVDPMDVTTYTIVYRPPNFKLRLFAFFASLWLASMLFTLGIYLANMVIGKSFLTLTKAHIYTNIPPEIYSIDPYSVMVTISCISKIVDTFPLEQIKRALDSEGIVKIMVLKDLLQTFFVKIIVGIRDSQILQTLLGQCIRVSVPLNLMMNSELLVGYRLKYNKFPLWGLPYLACHLVSSYHIFKNIRALFRQRRTEVDQIYKLHIYVAVFSLTCRIFILFWKFLYWRYVKNVPASLILKHSFLFDFIVEQIELKYYYAEALPMPLAVFFSKVMYNLGGGVEPWVYYILVNTVYLYEAFMLVSDGWGKFIDKTKQLYFDNNKVLTNADDEDEDEDEDDEVAGDNDNNEGEEQNERQFLVMNNVEIENVSADEALQRDDYTESDSASDSASDEID